MSNIPKYNTKVLTEVSMLLGLGFVLKLITDLFTRTALSFLFIDILLIISVVILFRNPTLKVAISVAVVQFFVSATLFTTTDIWFVRPFIVLIAFGVVKFFLSREWKDKTKFIWSCFLTSKLTVLFVSLILMIFLFLNPSLIGLDTIIDRMNDLQETGALTQEHIFLLEENINALLLVVLLLLGFIYSYIPAIIHLIIGLLIYRVIRKK